MKDKKLYIIIMSFVSVIIIAYSLSLAKTEAPISPSELIVDIKAKEPSRIDDAVKYVIVSRSVVVPQDITKKTKAVLLTIDDGPSPRTGEIITILKNHNAKAIFFINGMNDKKNSGIISQIKEEGFTLGNHTWNHINLKKQKDMGVIDNEINKTTELILKNTGTPPRFFRAPFGESNPYIRNFVKDQGMLFMDWSGSAMDWDKSTKEKDIFVGNVMSNVHPGSIILIHEHPWSVANLDSLLTTLEIAGYTYINPENIIE